MLATTLKHHVINKGNAYFDNVYLKEVVDQSNLASTLSRSEFAKKG